MKYVIVLGDGMSDFPIPQLGDKTPLQAAKKPNMDYFASYGEAGLVSTIPPTLSPGSDVANLSVMGYDPVKYYTGRSPLEAISIGVPMDADDITFRTNLVTLSDDETYENKVMMDHSCDEITTEEAAPLIEAVNRHFHNDVLTFFKGVSYRHCLLWKGGTLDSDLTPPHDILDQKITPYLPKGVNADLIFHMMKESYELLSNHPVNRGRIRRGQRPANSIWIWGQGRKPAIPAFYDLHGLKGAVISAVDLIKGLGLSAGMDSITVEGATGNLHTNYMGKTNAALKALEEGIDFVYIHIEAPDECGHRGEIDNKVRAIEYIDEKLLVPLLAGLEQYEDYKVLVLPDHATPLSLKTHTSDPVPYAMYQKSKKKQNTITSYDEFSLQRTGNHYPSGPALLTRFLQP